MQRVKLGTKVKPLGINRLDVAEGYKCRAVLIDPDPVVKFIGWSEELKRKVELNQDLVIKYGFRPMTTYYYLVAKLNTDMNSNIVNDQFTVEYLQLSENVNNEFIDSLNEMPNFTSLSLSKVKKVAEGRDYSYIKVIPSSVTIPQGILDQIEQIRSTEGAVESMWKLIDAQTSITPEQFERLLADPNANLNEPAQVSAPQVAAPQVKPRSIPQPKQSQSQSVPQTAPIDTFSNEDLGLGDDFDNFDN